MPIAPTFQHGPMAHALTPSTTAVEIDMAGARTWRCRLTNTGAQAITAITLAESPLGGGYGAETATLGTLAPGASMDVQGSDDYVTSARFTFAVPLAGEVTIEAAGV